MLISMLLQKKLIIVYDEVEIAIMINSGQPSVVLPQLNENLP
jgi:hypothetical protein